MSELWLTEAQYMNKVFLQHKAGKRLWRVKIDEDSAWIYHEYDNYEEALSKFERVAHMQWILVFKTLNNK